jgi:FemAB-related protein (PEP-CTERM system-associated)
VSATVGLDVRVATSADLARWDAFVDRCPETTFFHKAGWKEVIGSVFRHRTFYLFAERDATIVGVLPLAQVKSLLFGHTLVSLPFCVYGGVAATDPAAVPALHAAARELAGKLGADHLELRNRIAREPGWPRQDLYVTFRREMLPDVEANLLAIPRKQRAMVRKGIQRGLYGEIDASVDRFFALYADNVHRHGTPALPRRYFETLQRVFGRDVEILTVLDTERKPVSSVLTFYFRDEVLPYYAGDDVTARDLAANDFKYWDLMRRACERVARG